MLMTVDDWWAIARWMSHSEVNEGIICVFPPLDRFLFLGLIYSVNSTKSYPFIRCRIVVPNTKLNLVYLCYLEKRYKTFYLRKRQLESEIALLERRRRFNEHYSHRTCRDRKKNSQSKMINEREASRRFFRRESIISSREVNEEEKTSTIYHIENLKQLRDWMRENSKVISFMI
jgi:hypothetical protein